MKITPLGVLVYCSHFSEHDKVSWLQLACIDSFCNLLNNDAPSDLRPTRQAPTAGIPSLHILNHCVHKAQSNGESYVKAGGEIKGE